MGNRNLSKKVEIGHHKVTATADLGDLLRAYRWYNSRGGQSLTESLLMGKERTVSFLSLP